MISERREKVSASRMTNRLHLPGMRLLFYALHELADDDGRVMGPSAELLRAAGWANRASLRKRTHELEEAGVVTIERSTRRDGGQGPNVYVLNGDDHR